MILNVILLILGFFLLVKGSDAFVDGSASLARLMGIPPIVIGLTIVAAGTSAPEAAVSITAAMRGSNGLALSNLIGSNTFNILCVAGISALIFPLCAVGTVLKRDFPVCLGITLLTILLSLDGRISRTDGIILLVIFVSYTAVLVVKAFKGHTAAGVDGRTLSPVKSVIFAAAGLAAIILGGRLVVTGAKAAATYFGMSETLIAITVVAIGTSLPELVTSAAASRKGQSEIAIGNVIGSNTFNLSFILGLSSALCPMTVGAEALADAIIMLTSCALGFVFCKIGKKIGRAEGAALVCAYAAYMVYLIIR